MPLPHRLPKHGGFPDWVGEGRFVPAHRLSAPAASPSGGEPESLYFIWQGNKLLHPERPGASAGEQRGGAASGPVRMDAPGPGAAFPLARLPAGLPELRRSMLGWLDGRACLAVDVADGFAAPAGYAWTGLRGLFGTLEDGMVALAGRGFQVLEWERTHQFCGRCATPMRFRAHERSRECPACSFIAYPRISPVVMALVVRGRELLLARSPHFAPGMYSAVAGFVETGESLEQSLAREVLEETGIHAGQFQYFDSQPWPFPHSLMVAFTAEYLSGDPVPQPEEIEDVRWFDVDALPTLPPTLSIAGRLIRAVTGHLREVQRA